MTSIFAPLIKFLSAADTANNRIGSVLICLNLRLSLLSRPKSWRAWIKFLRGARNLAGLKFHPLFSVDLIALAAF